MLINSLADSLHVKVDSSTLTNVNHFLGQIECADSEFDVNLQISTIQVKIRPYLANIDNLLNTLSLILNKNVIGILGCDYMHAVGAIVDMQNKQLYIMKSTK